MGDSLFDEIIKSMIVANAPVPRPVAEVSLETGKVLNVYRSINDASKSTGVDRHSVSHCCNGTYKQVKGRRFVWVRKAKV